MRIVLTTDCGRDLATIALIHRLTAEGHSVVLVVERRGFSLQGFVQGGGWQNWWRNLLTRPQQDVAQEGQAALIRALDQEGVVDRTVEAACARVSAKHMRIACVNHDSALMELAAQRPDLVLCLGSQTVSADGLNIPFGVLRVCTAAPEHVDGADPLSWSIVSGHSPCVSIVSVVPGMPVGEEHARRAVPVDGVQSLAALRAAAQLTALELVPSVVRDLAAGDSATDSLDLHGAETYAPMATALREVVDRWVADGRVAALRG